MELLNLVKDLEVQNSNSMLRMRPKHMYCFSVSS